MPQKPITCPRCDNLRGKLGPLNRSDPEVSTEVMGKRAFICPIHGEYLVPKTAEGMYGGRYVR